jgi:heme exporter protein D
VSSAFAGFPTHQRGYQERDVSEFLAMGGYGAYVWTAYGVTALALVLLFIWSWLGARAREAELEQVRRLSRSERRQPATATLSAASVDDGRADLGATIDAGPARMSAGESGGGVN